MKDVHVNPMEAVQAHRDLRSEYSLGMHFGTFQLTYEAIDQPSRDLATALTELDVDPEHFQIIAPCDTREINTAASGTPRPNDRRALLHLVNAPKKTRQLYGRYRIPKRYISPATLTGTLRISEAAYVTEYNSPSP